MIQLDCESCGYYSTVRCATNLVHQYEVNVYSENQVRICCRFCENPIFIELPEDEMIEIYARE